MEPEWRRSPDGAIDRERQVDERPRHVLQHDGAQVPQRVERSIVRDGMEVIPDERVVQRVQVGERRAEHRRADQGQTPSAARTSGHTGDGLARAYRSRFTRGQISTSNTEM